MQNASTEEARLIAKSPVGSSAFAWSLRGGHALGFLMRHDTRIAHANQCRPGRFLSGDSRTVEKGGAAVAQPNFLKFTLCKRGKRLNRTEVTLRKSIPKALLCVLPQKC